MMQQKFRNGLKGVSRVKEIKKTPKKSIWEVLECEDGTATRRLTVPGGWIYQTVMSHRKEGNRVRTIDDVSTMFVPEVYMETICSDGKLF